MLRMRVQLTAGTHPMRYHDLPIAADTDFAGQVLGMSPATIRRLAKTDPSFPKPFAIGPGGRLRWPMAELLRWLEARAGRPLEMA